MKEPFRILLSTTLTLTLAYLQPIFKSFKSIRFGIPSCWHPRNTKKKREPKFSRKLIDTGLLTAMGYSQRGPYQKEKREGNLEIHVPK